MSWFRRPPDFVIGSAQSPYILRWYVISRNRWLNIYLHKFLRDDDDRALHDHPWWFISIMLRGQYTEIREEGSAGSVRRAPSIAYRRATDRHRIVLQRNAQDRSVPCWTLVITGPRIREWGFHCPKGWVPWHQFVDARDNGQVGRGCD